MTVISLSKALRERLTDEGADALSQILDKLSDDTQKAALELADQRFERRLAQVDAKIEQVKADLIKWMFVFMFGQYWLIVGTITGILFALLRK